MEGSSKTHLKKLGNHKGLQFQIREGTPLPLGVRLVRDTVYFSVSAPNTKECTLNIYSKDTKELIEAIILKEPNKVGNIFYLAIENFDYAQYDYMYEVEGKEFIDPYVKLLTARKIFGKPLNAKELQYLRGEFLFDTYKWEGDQPLKLNYEDLIIYRLHVRGFTKDQSAKVKNKGTYQGIIEKIPYLTSLGINAVELLPTYEYDEIIMEQSPMRRDITSEAPYKINYWGYTNQGNYFAPKASYAADVHNPATEYKNLIKDLHKAGIEVFMDFYFALGTKEQLILDCLRYWVEEYHIDGFKVNSDVISSKLLATDPFLSETKILGLTWNADEVYGKEYTPIFKNLAEYNEGFQTDIRRFLKGDEEHVRKAAFRIKNNPDKLACINFITNTNGFTLMDLFSYDLKHNEDNGEKGYDGTDYNYSWNCGVEGNTKRKKVLELRRKQIKNGFILLLLSQGVPLILAGDEFGNSQQGNNNAYCQDNKITWLDWKQEEVNNELLDFVKQLIQIRKSHPILHGKEELRGMDYASCGYPDLSYHSTKAWYPDYSNYNRMLGIMICGRYAMVDRKNHDNSFYLAFNMHWEDHEFDLPKLDKGSHWYVLIDTSYNQNTGINAEETVDTIVENQKKYMVKARTIVIFIGR